MSTLRSRINRDVAGASAVAVAPLLVLIIRAASTPWIASGDYSLIELQTRQVGGSHTPLVGPYSRFGWSHPGPALFFALSAPFRILASRGAGLLVGAAIINAVAIVAIVAILLHAPAPRLVRVFGLLVTAVLLRGLGGSFLWDPWNPRVIVLPFFAFVLFSWWAATGEARALPVAVALASFVTQTHVSLVPETIALLVLALVWLLPAARAGGAGRRLRRSILAAVGIFAVMWSPPVVQQFQHDGGNLSALWRFWTTSHPDTVGFSNGARLLAPQLSIPAPWMSGHEHFDPVTGGLVTPRFAFPFALVLLAIAALVAWRRRDRIGLTACSFAATSVLVAWISIARVIGIPFPYVLRWDWVVGATCWIAAGIALLPAVADRLHEATRSHLAHVMAAGAAVLLAVVTVTSAGAVTPLAAVSRAAGALTTQTAPHLRGVRRPIRVQADIGSVFVADGVISGLTERGVNTLYPAPLLEFAGQRPPVDDPERGTFIFVAVGDDVARYARDPAYRQVAAYNSLTLVAAVFMYSVRS